MFLCVLYEPSFPQDGDTELGTVAASCRERVVTGLLSALVIWTETRREEGTGPPVGHTGHGQHYQPRGSSTGRSSFLKS